MITLRRLLWACCLASTVDVTLAAGTGTGAPKTRDAGILYEIWHTGAAHLMQRVKASGATQPVTVETVIRSDGKHTLG